MKRFLIVVLLFFIALDGFSQINRTIWGVTLGKSTKQQVRTVLIEKGYNVDIDPDGSLAVRVYNVVFGGAHWTYISFSFVNGYLSNITFQNNEQQSPVRIENTYEKLKESLNKKYSFYRLSLPGADDDGHVLTCYSDGKTSLVLDLSYFRSRRYISLFYEDEELQLKKRQNAEDEL